MTSGNVHPSVAQPRRMPLNGLFWVITCVLRICTTKTVAVLPLCRYAWRWVYVAFWGVCLCSSRWRSVWTWSNRWRTALTRSWLPACRVSRALIWRRDPSSHRLWVPASTVLSDTDALRWGDVASFLILHESYRSCIISLYYQKKLPLTILAQCMVEGAAVLGDDSLLGWVTVLNGPLLAHFPSMHAHTERERESSLIIDLAIEFFSVLITLVCILIAFDCLWLCAVTEQEDAEAVWGDRGEAGPGAHPVWVPDRERCGGASLCACGGEPELLLLNAPIKT